MNKTLHWAPRIIAIIYIVFLSLFAMDVFGEGYSFLETIVALFMHLIPTLLLTAITVLAWKKEKIGGIAFIALGIIFTIFFSTHREIMAFLLISLPVLTIGILFLLNHFKKN
jgi:hypothetical protein